MHKTVLLAGLVLAAAYTANGQTRVDSLQKKVFFSKPATDSSQPKPLFFTNIVPANFYSAHLPFFCDKELKLQKAIKIPVKFRVGSVTECDRLEGKQ